MLLTRVGAAFLCAALGSAVLSGAKLEQAFLATTASDDFCNPGPRATQFLTTDARAWVYVLVSGTQIGDQLAVEWVTPSGTTYLRNNFQPLNAASTFCFDDSLAIAGQRAAQQPGNWMVRGFWNGAALFSLNFPVVQAALPCSYTLSPASRSFEAVGGPGSFGVITGSGCAWTATSSSAWLTTTSGASGSGNGTVNYSVAANTATTARTGTLVVAGQTHTVTQAAAAPVAQGPAIASGGVVNAADYTPNIAPGSILAISGVSLASKTASASNVPLPTTLEGSSVEVVDGVNTLNAPLFFVSAVQIFAQMPFEVSGASVQVRVRTSSGVSQNAPVTITPQAPRLFTRTQDGMGEPILLHTDYTVVSAGAPAQNNEIVILYLTGLGAVSPPVPSGSPAGDGSEQAPLNLVSLRPNVTIGGKPAQVLFAGLVPYFVGLYQLTIRMPATVTSGQQPVVVTAGSKSSQASVQAAVRSSWQPVATASVGSQGATLSGAGTTITVPAGAFQNSEVLSISRMPGDGTSAGDYYLLDGMPQASRASITIAVDGSPLPGEDGEPVIAIRVDGTAADPTLRLVRAQYQGGKIVATLPAFDAEPSAQMQLRSGQTQANQPVRPAVADRPSWMYYAWRGFKPSTSASRMFVVMATKDVPAGRASQLADAADTAYNRLSQDLRLQWDRLPAQYWPIEIWAYKFEGGISSPSPDAWGVVPEPYWRNSGSAHLNATYTQTDAQMALMIPTVGHELFHVLQNLYDPRTGVQMNQGADTPWLWYEEASATWFERIVSNDPPNYVPTTLSPNGIRNEEKSDNYVFIKSGLASPNERDHGYGASMFLQHLSNKFGARLIGDILKPMATLDPASTVPWPRYTPMQVIAQQSSISIDAEWKEFCRNYMAGTLYGRPNGDRFPTTSNIIGLYKEKYPMANPDDHLFSFATWNAPDLSANLFGVLFNNVTLRDNTPLTVRVDYSNAELILYRATGNNLERIADRVTEYTINNAEQLQRDRSQLVIMVVNPRAVEPYTGATPITVSVQLGTSILPKLQKTTWLEAQFVSSGIMIRLANGTVQPFGNSPPAITIPHTDTQWMWNVPGSTCRSVVTKWTGREFDYSGTCVNILDSRQTGEWKMKGTVNPGGTVLETADFSSKNIEPRGPSSTITTTQAFSVKNLPFTPEGKLCTEGGDSGLTFRIWTSDVKDHVSNIGIEDVDTYDPTSNYRYERTDWDKGAAVTIRFWCK